jgi:hypothetical protein
VPTKDLAEVASFTARVQTAGEGKDARDFVEFPMRLEPGWYLVTHHSSAQDEQAVLEVTDVATFVTFSDTKSLVWVNDVRSGGDRQAAIPTADRLGCATSADGLATLDMPAGDLSSSRHQPAHRRRLRWAGPTSAGTGGSGDDGFWLLRRVPPSDDYWLLTHRPGFYRSTDEIDAWGVVAGAMTAIPVDARST